MNTRPPFDGLTPQQVAQARAKFGWNELPQAAPVRAWRIFLRQFSSFLVLILVVAAGVALAMGEHVDAAAVGLVIILNAVLGFVQEWRAETALNSLREMLAPQAIVIREGRERMIPAREIVPGDLLVLQAGGRISADAQITECHVMQVDESVLTGESMPLSKAPNDPVFAGTVVVQGRAEALVSAIGAASEFGQVALLTGSVGEKITPLQRHLGRLAHQLGFAALAVAAGLVLLGLALSRDMGEMFMMGLSLAVAMVPEGLPAVVTITLALGAAAMVRQKALARRLQAVETLGAASVICTDKTGTLTENKMTATDIWTLEKTYQVTGTGYDPAGHIEVACQSVRAADDPVLAALLRTGMTCTHAGLERAGQGWQMIGSPTEGALVTLGLKGWSLRPDPTKIISELPFSSERKRMSVLVRDGVGQGAQGVVYMKGAPEVVLDLCQTVMTQAGATALGDDVRDTIREAYETMAARGLRVIACALRETPDLSHTEAEMRFIGFVGLIDPPRPEVKQAVAGAKSAGIKIVMITGDSPKTASAIAAGLDLPVAHSIIGDAVEAMSDSDLRAAVKCNVLFARTKPAHKMRIVQALQAQDLIVAMTGDGVNDAPALKQADIGVAMGIRGTDVAREAADLVLLDDNFATIVRAIREGRRQFANVKKFVRYLLSSNAGEVVALVANIAIGGPLIFLATQILWMNLVTDGVTAVALGLERAEPDAMRRPPRSQKTAILGWGGIAVIATLGLYTGSASLFIFYQMLDAGVEIARTAAFTAMVVFEKISVFAFRSLRLPCWRIGLLSNPFLLGALALTLGAQVAAIYWPPLQTLLHTVPLGKAEWLMILYFALPILVVPEVLKSLRLLQPAKK